MILVTGGTGLVGSHLLCELASKNVKIRVLKRSNSDLTLIKKNFLRNGKDFEKLSSNIEWVNGDVLDTGTLYDAMIGVDRIYHCAGMVSFYGKDRQKMLITNINGTANMVNAALNAGVRKICHVSSISALGKTRQGETLTENHFWKTSSKNSVYAISKYGAEREVWRGTEEGLEAVIVNPAIIIGPGNWNSGSSKLFSTVWKGMFYYTNGVNSYVDVRDVVKIMIRLMESDIKNQRFILSAGDLSYRNIIGIIALSFNKKHPFFKLSPWMGEIAWRLERIKLLFGVEPTYSKEIARSAFHRFYCSNRKIVDTIGYHFTPVQDTLRSTANHFMVDINERKP